MFGKHFESMYQGSLVGSGAEVFAVWGYVISHMRPPTFTVELNPKLLAFILGEPEKEIESAIEVLCAPDPKSRTKGREGRRLVREGEYQYLVVNGAKYQAIRRAEERREYHRQYGQERRGGNGSDGQPGGLAGHSSPGSGNRPESVEVVIAAGSMLGVPEPDCRKFWDYYESSSQEGANGEVIWVMGKAGEKRVGQWQSLLKQWYENRRGNESHPTRQRVHIPVAGPPVTDLKLPIVPLVPRPRKPNPEQPPSPQPSQPSPSPS